VKSWKNKLYSVVNSKENVEIVVKLVTNHSSASIVLHTMVEITETELEQIFACTVANRAMTRRVASNSRRRKHNGHASNFNSKADRRNYESQDVVFLATSKNKILTDDIWIYDSRAWRDYCKSDKSLFDVKEINEKITLGNGESMKSIKVGSLKCHAIQLNGSSVDVTLKEVKYVPELWMNLFTISKALKNGLDLSKKGLMISLKKGSVTVTFDRVIKTVNGSISGIKMTTYDPSVAYIAKDSLTAIKEIDVNKSHEMIRHCGVDRLKKTTNIHGLKLKGEFKVCEDCAVAKSRQRNVSKDWKGGSQLPGERVYLDISSIKGGSYGGSCFWALVVDDHTDYC
jgi:hypothetical protein